jgi:hypothetical protein
LWEAITGSEISVVAKNKIACEGPAMRAKSLFAVVMFIAIGATACGSSSKGATGSAGAAPTTGKLTGSSSSNFCDLARADAKAFSDNNPSGMSVDDLKKQYENLGPALQQAADAAPSAIKGDLETFINAFAPYLQALSDANYDFTKIDASSVAGLQSPSVQAASDHIQQYFTQVCHITTPAS